MFNPRIFRRSLRYVVPRLKTWLANQLALPPSQPKGSIGEDKPLWPSLYSSTNLLSHIRTAYFSPPSKPHCTRKYTRPTNLNLHPICARLDARPVI